MAYPKTYHAWRRSTTLYPRSLVLSTETLPDKLEAKDVLIQIHAVSLNYRDVAMLQEGAYPVPVEDGGVTASDSAAEVIAIGDEVTKFVIGDHVAATNNLLSLTGDEREMDELALGGNGPGTLRQYAIFKEEVLVRLPAHLSWEEAATIPGAAVTAWKALDGLEKIHPDTTALLQGTGGCSFMSVLICIAAGIKPIVTSSSDDKLSRLLKLSPTVHGINYRTADVKAEVLKITNGKGVDFILNNVGLSSIPDDLEMVRRSGSIAFVGFLGGFDANWSPQVLLTLLLKACKIQGMRGSSRADLEAVCAFLEAKKVKVESIIDKVFTFQEAPEAYKYLATGKHIGKVVIKVS